MSAKLLSAKTLGAATARAVKRGSFASMGTYAQTLSEVLANSEYPSNVEAQGRLLFAFIDAYLTTAGIE